MRTAAATSFETRSPDRVLTAVTERQQVIARAEADLFVLAVEWAALHPGDQVDTTTPYQERDLEVAGDGAPTVAEYALVEFAAATGRSTTSRACDLDHLTPWPLGPTATWNLASC